MGKGREDKAIAKATRMITERSPWSLTAFSFYGGGRRPSPAERDCTRANTYRDKCITIH